MNEDEARATLRNVVAIVEDENVPNDLRVVAFEHVWGALTEESRESSGSIVRDRGEATGGEIESAVAGLADRLGVRSQEAEEAFEAAGDGTFRVIAPPNRVASVRTRGTIELALLVCAGRQYAAENATPSAVIREVCDEYGRLDPANYAATMAQRTDLWIISGSGQERTFRLRRGAWQEAGAVVHRVAGTGDE